jgi:hypothetical protein
MIIKIPCADCGVGNPHRGKEKELICLGERRGNREITAVAVITV